MSFDERVQFVKEFLEKQNVAAVSKHVTNSGARIHYITSGSSDKPCVVFIHGAGGNCCSWWRNLPGFTEKGFFCIAVDIRGFGVTGACEVEEAFKGGETYAQDLVSILRAEGVQRAVILCQSAFGCAGVHMFANHSDLTAGLVMSNTNRGVERDDEDQRLASEFQMDWPSEWPVKGLSPAFQEKEPELTSSWCGLRSLNNPGFRAGEEAVCRENVIPIADVSQVKTPCLMISSGFDPFFSKAMMERSATHFSKCDHIHFPAYGHSVYFEDPKVFNETVINWIRKFVFPL
eukprot:TRINITY_DN63749_c0_g1_i1.p1 TRINITY_DN63749_c0_g1~~TRINITY_DN63749_c0_g1_i1.p1  ORF type:complete len:289 (+),score=33.10 TRINITY_DN63749_c0_g1_i1:64-930(+)